MEGTLENGGWCDPWTTLTGPITPDQIIHAVRAAADQLGLMLEHLASGTLRLVTADGMSRTVVRWRPAVARPPSTLGYQIPPQALIEVLITGDPGDDMRSARQVADAVQAIVLPYSAMELETIVASMPMVRRYATPDPALADWALIFRDHYLEHSVGFLLGMQRAGIPAEWIYSLAKGDRTRNRHRVHATFLARGFRSGVLDNAAINAPPLHATELEQIKAELDLFIDAAHATGRRVLVIDDGGLLACGYGSVDGPRRVDAAIELTVSGLKRIAAAGTLVIPVFNMARSTVKALLGYPEIADSCLRRLQALLPACKLIGRPVLLLGYGSLGARLANALRSLGARVSIVDTDTPALVVAAEAGYRTYRRLADALSVDPPFLLIGTTGELALTEADLPLLPDGIHLAPFATRDFSVLSDTELVVSVADIPGIGRHYRLTTGKTVLMLGDGRSMNLFEADSIPNQGYDAYRAGTIIAAKALCTDPGRIPTGVHTGLADEAMTAAGLFDTYYDLYLTLDPGAAESPRCPTSVCLPSTPRQGLHACIVGYGAAGRLHAAILSDLGVTLTVIDPKHQDLPNTHRTFPYEVDHLPACQGHEITEFIDLLARHPQARVVVNDHYRHSTTLPAFTELIKRLEPDAPLSQVRVAFTKDRTKDIAHGRFIDRAYGVLGYEWLHMLAALSRILSDSAFDGYMRSEPAAAELWATYEPRLFVAALTERTVLPTKAGPIHVELASSILGPHILVGTIPIRDVSWRRDIRAADNRSRHVVAFSGDTRFALHMDPVTAHGGWQLDRNHHRLTADCNGHLLHDQVLEDSPLHTAARHAITALLADTALPPPDLAPLRRIAALADYLRAAQPAKALAK